MDMVERLLSTILSKNYEAALHIITAVFCIYFIKRSADLEKQINRINKERIGDMNEAKRELISILKKSHDIIEFLRGSKGHE